MNIANFDYIGKLEKTYIYLLPVRPPSLTYLTLGVMLEPYARDVVYLSGEWHRVGRRHFAVHLLFL